MKEIFKKTKFEELLVHKWSEFLDPSKLMTLVADLVRDNMKSFEYIPNYTHKRKGSQIMISNLQYQQSGFVIWVDFMIPIEHQRVAVGTTEIFLLHSGILSHSKTLGNVYDSN